jgi:hypothetical protein
MEGAVMIVENKPILKAEILVTLSEEEARALEALAGYGDDAFIKAFYERLGKAYMGPHEAGLRSLFANATSKLGSALKKIDAARAAMVYKS